MYCAAEPERRLVLPHKVDLSTGQRDLLAAEFMELKRFNHMGRQREIPIESRIQQGVNLTVPTILAMNEKREDDLSVPGYATNRCHDECFSLDQRFAPR